MYRYLESHAFGNPLFFINLSHLFLEFGYDENSKFEKHITTFFPSLRKLEYLG